MARLLLLVCCSSAARLLVCPSARLLLPQVRHGVTLPFACIRTAFRLHSYYVSLVFCVLTTFRLCSHCLSLVFSLPFFAKTLPFSFRYSAWPMNSRSRSRSRLATAGSAVLLHPPPALAGVPIEIESGCQYFDSAGMSQVPDGMNPGDTIVVELEGIRGCRAHRLSLTFHCLSLPFRSVFAAFHCLLLLFHRLSPQFCLRQVV